MLMLSLGTGGGYVDLGNTANAARWKLLSWASKTPDIMMDGALHTVNYQMQKLFESLEGEEVKNYKRVDFPKLKDSDMPPYSTDMADASPDNVAILQRSGALTVQHANMTSNTEHALDTFVDEMIAAFNTDSTQ